jgi:homoserine kinase type II
MAVFTPVEKRELSHWLENFSQGELLHCEGIAAGIENSNFFVTTTGGEFVLTLFERLSADELPFYLGLMQHLASHGVACPRPAVAKNGALFMSLNGKPAALVGRLRGKSARQPDAGQCAITARAMAAMHLAGRDFAIAQRNPRGVEWWKATVPLVLPYLDASLARLLEEEVAEVSDGLLAVADVLPAGPIHADLFRDNVLFDGSELGGFIDFYFAGCDAWLLDVAVCVNDWCIVHASGEIVAPLASAFVGGYAAIRPYTPEERAAWPLMLRAAALRFWLSRLADVVLPRSATLLTPHDPRHFERIVMRRHAESARPVVALP